jgi:GT2 family glycosyltransferase
MSESPPDISVAVVNWNRRGHLRACLESLAGQRDANFEVIVVDNGSSDGSAEMARTEFGVQVIANVANLGFCAANNQAFAAARGRFIALLNNDAEAEPDFLANLQRAFEAGPDVGMAAAKVLVREDPRGGNGTERVEHVDRIDKVGHLIYPDGQNRGRGTGEIDHGQYSCIEDCLWPDGCAGMYRKTMLEQIGGFDEDFFMFADDAELGLRARIAGWRCLYMPGAIVRHQRGASLDAGSPRRIFLIERNRMLLAAKLFPWSLLLLNPYYFALRLASGVAAAAGGKGEMARFPGLGGKLRLAWTIVRADLAALRLLPRMFGKRREVRRIAKLTPVEIRRLILGNRIAVRELVEKSN